SSLLKKSQLRHSEAEGRRISDGDAILRFAQDDENRVFQQTVSCHCRPNSVIYEGNEESVFVETLQPYGLAVEYNCPEARRMRHEARGKKDDVEISS
ncbi:MAG: hypothetical protein WBE75_04450, partial [Candidatus Omnitrophota bacterium]